MFVLIGQANILPKDRDMKYSNPQPYTCTVTLLCPDYIELMC